MEKMKQLNDEQLAMVTGGIESSDEWSILKDSESSMSEEGSSLSVNLTQAAAGADKKKIKEYKEYIIPSDIGTL